MSIRDLISNENTDGETQGKAKWSTTHDRRKHADIPALFVESGSIGFFNSDIFQL